MVQFVSRSVQRRFPGFTLVELMIVVGILAILAAIVLPRYSSASDSAKLANVKTTLSTVRGQLQRYYIDHNQTYPDLVTDGWAGLTQKTNPDGSLDADGAFGPYLRMVPINPITQSSLISATETEGRGWYYNQETGSFFAVGFDEAMDTFK